MSVSEAALVRYERLAESHLDAIMAIEVEAYPEPWSVEMFCEEVRSPRSQFFVMFLDDVLVGYGGFWLVLDEAHITSVTVHRDYRGRRLGWRLMVYLLRLASELDARRAFLEVRESNEVARNLYKRLGFRETGLRKAYYQKTRENAVVMERLDAASSHRRRVRSGVGGDSNGGDPTGDRDVRARLQHISMPSPSLQNPCCVERSCSAHRLPSAPPP